MYGKWVTVQRVKESKPIVKEEKPRFTESCVLQAIKCFVRFFTDKLVHVFTGESSSNTEQPSGDNDHRPPGGRGRDEENEREAKRLAEEANRMMEAARAELQLDKEATKRGAEKDADIAGRLAHLQGVQPVENTG